MDIKTVRIYVQLETFESEYDVTKRKKWKVLIGGKGEKQKCSRYDGQIRARMIAPVVLTDSPGTCRPVSVWFTRKLKTMAGNTVQFPVLKSNKTVSGGSTFRTRRSIKNV